MDTTELVNQAKKAIAAADAIHKVSHEARKQGGQVAVARSVVPKESTAFHCRSCIDGLALGISLLDSPGPNRNVDNNSGCGGLGNAQGR